MQQPEAWMSRKKTTTIWMLIFLGAIMPLKRKAVILKVLERGS
jgi:hypothetical protein